MKKNSLYLILFITILVLPSRAQLVVTPLGTTNYNRDAVAETTPSSLTTSGAIDGSDYIMLSQAYAALYSMTLGLPNNGLISAGTRTYQLQPYTQNNMSFITTGLTDSLILTTPASIPALSILGFATEGAGTMNVTIRFTDNTTQIYNNISLLDWFNGAGTFYNSFGRANRTSGTISNPTGAPHMYAVDFVISCNNRIKLVKNIKFQNTGTNPRLCIMAVSGAAGSTITSSSNPVTCSGASNGTASVTIVGGTGPFTYSWSTSPAQTGAQANSVPVGVYSVTITDAASCAVTSTVSVTQSLSPQPPLQVSSNGTAVCLGGTVALGASGASTYTWSTGSNQSIVLNLMPTSTTLYTVSGLTAQNCLLSGSITIVVNPNPTITISGLPTNACINANSVSISGSPSGGVFSGLGVYQGVYTPSNAGVGTGTVSYSYTNNFNCSATLISTVVVNALPLVSFSMTNTSFCKNNPAYTLTGSGVPVGGTFSGPGVVSPVFNPSQSGVGSQVLSYSYTDANSCTDVSTLAITVSSLAAPNLTISKSIFCANSNSLFLQVSPSGGAFSGGSVTANGIFSPALAGIGVFTISYAITSAPCTESSAITVTVSNCSGLQETRSTAFELFPNPNAGVFTLRSNKTGILEVYSQNGALLQSEVIIASEENKIQLNNFASGIYFVNLITDGQILHQKILVN